MSNQCDTLVTGATGYVGGRLVRALEEQGVRVRCLARRPAYLRPRVSPSIEVVQGDVRDIGSLRAALQGISVAYYLVHSMADDGDFQSHERTGAENFAVAAREAGVERIIYLGGLGEEGTLSKHLESRHMVGRILRDSGVPAFEFRGSIIIGSGSLSFELIRALVRNLPVMVTPRWVRVPAQPIAVEDVIAYLATARTAAIDLAGLYEIGGADRVTYEDIIREYARQRGLRRYMISVPVLTPKLSSLWLGLVTPVYARVGRKLVESLRSPTVVRDHRAEQVFSIRPRGMAQAIERALTNEDAEFAATRWNDAGSAAPPVDVWGGAHVGQRIVDSRVSTVSVSASRAFAPIRRIGGREGWYYANWLWSLRGFLDLLVGGVGSRRGRRDPDQLRAGDSVDFWRVEAIEPDRLVRFRAEMKVPGRAWLQFEVDRGSGVSTIRQTAIFEPLGLAGMAYWYLLYPVHELVFRGMLRGIARAAETENSERASA